MSSHETQYRSRPVRSFQIDQVSAVLACSSPHAESWIFVLKTVPSLLEHCLVPRTLEGHKAVLLDRMPNATSTFLDTMLTGLAKAGLLVAADTEDPGGRAAPRPLDVIAVTTADRPDILSRCLDSYVAHLQTYGQSLDVLVVDDSAKTAAAAHNRAIVLGLSQRTGRRIRYVGQEEQAALRSLVASCGADPRVLRGISRNSRSLVLLLTVGQRVLMASDRTTCTGWSSGTVSDVLQVGGHADPRTYEFYESRDTALPPVDTPGADLLAAHARVLGLDVAQLVERGVDHDIRDMCGHMRDLLTHPRRALRVRMTTSGIAGDGGLAHPYSLLFRSGAIRELLGSDRDAFDRALVFREMRRIAERTVLVHDLGCECLCLGLDNTTLLPPFLSSDGLDGMAYGPTLHLCAPDSVNAHIPVGVVHATDREPAYSQEELAAPTVATWSEVIGVMLSQCGMSPFVADPGERLEYAGRHLLELTRRSTSEWKATIESTIVDKRAEAMLTISRLENAPTYPPYWTAAFGRYRSMMLQRLNVPLFFLPAEFSRLAGEAGALEAARTAMADWGELLRAWPALWEKARASGRSAELLHA